MPLTNPACHNAKPRKAAFKLFDEKGLYLEVAPSGGKWWRIKYRFGGKEKRLSLGVYPDVSLKTARSRRDTARELLENGTDPGEARKAEKHEAHARIAHRFAALANEWYTYKRPGWSDATADKVRFYLDKDLLPALGERPAPEIRRPELVELLRGLEQRDAFNVAKKARGWLNQIFRYALVKGVIETNPATDLDVVAARAPKTRHHPFVSASKLPALLRALESNAGAFLSVQAIKLLLLTGTRPGELRHATWAEFDLDGGLWSIPAERMKMRRPHSVPLPIQAVETLRKLHALTGSGALLFPSRDDANVPMSDNTINAAMRRMGFAQTGHGFRHLLSTMLNEQGYNRDWIERQLAHGDTNEVRGIYNHAAYMEQRRNMMQSWADYLDALRENRKVVAGNFGRAA